MPSLIPPIRALSPAERAEIRERHERAWQEEQESRRLQREAEMARIQEEVCAEIEEMDRRRYRGPLAPSKRALNLD